MREVIVGEAEVASHVFEGDPSILRDRAPRRVVGLASKHDNNGSIGREDDATRSEGTAKVQDGFGVERTKVANVLTFHPIPRNQTATDQPAPAPSTACDRPRSALEPAQ